MQVVREDYLMPEFPSRNHAVNERACAPPDHLIKGDIEEHEEGVFEQEELKRLRAKATWLEEQSRGGWPCGGPAREKNNKTPGVPLHTQPGVAAPQHIS